MRLFWIILLLLCAAVPVRADVTVRYQGDIQLNLPGPAKEAVQKSIKDQMARFSNLSIRMKNGKAAYDAGNITMITDYVTKQVTLIDREHKSYGITSLEDYNAQIIAGTPEMPEEAKKALAETKVSTEVKKGMGTDTILGIQAEEGQAILTMEFPAPTQNPGSMGMKMVFRIWDAAEAETLRNRAVREFTGYNIYANRLLTPAAMMQNMANMPLLKDVRNVMGDHRMVLRMRMELYAQFPPQVMQKLAFSSDTPHSVITMEATQVSSDPVDDAVFQVPADFQKVEASVILKSMMNVR